MKIPQIAVNRPITTIVLVVILILLGGVALQKLPVELYPDINLPIAVVMTGYPGAGPEEVESIVTKSVEEALQTVSDVKTLTSFSKEGESLVLIEFEWGTDLKHALANVRQQLDVLRKYLPDGVESPYTLEYDPTKMPIINYAVTGNMPLTELRNIVDDLIVPRLESLNGVASVEISGGYEREVKVYLDPALLRLYGIAIESVVQSIYASNLDYPAGDITIANQRQLLLRTKGEFTSIADIENVIIPGKAGIYRLGDIATVEDGYKEMTMYTRANGLDSIGLAIQKEGSANTIQASEKVKAELKLLQDEFGDDLTFSTITDHSRYVRFAVNTVINNALVGGGLAIIILLAFLSNITTTLVIGLSIPISIVATLFLLFVFKIKLNIMALAGLALGVGMLVDNAIVVLESNYRYLLDGVAAKEAAVKGTNEVIGAITASTITTLVVFLPVVFIEGISSQIFKDLSFTVAFALIFSLFVSVTVIPMFFSRLMTKVTPALLEKRQEKNPISRFIERLSKIYGTALEKCLRYRWVCLGVVLLLFASIAVVYNFIGTEFLPELDEGQIRLSIEMPRGTPHQRTDQVVTYFEESFKDIPEIDIFQVTVGVGRMGDEANIDVALVDLTKRKRSTKEIMEELKVIAGAVKGADISVIGVSTLMGGTELANAPIQVNILGDDLDVLEEVANDVKRIMESIPGTSDVKIGLEDLRPELQIQVDSRKAGTYGLTSAQIANSVRMAIAGQLASRYRGEKKGEIDIVVQYTPEARNSLRDLEQMPIMTAFNSIIPLSEVATIKEGFSPTEIKRLNRYRTIPVYTQVYGANLGDVKAQIEARLSKMQLPAGMSYEYGGETGWMDEAFNDLFLALLFGIVLVFLVLASQYESVWQPFVILFSVPFGFVGVAWALLLTGYTLNVASLVGAIMLVGIVVNNAIVLLDYINQLRNNGKERLEAIITAGKIRLRPILMTTLTTVLGMLPLALGMGEGAELYGPIAVVVISGLSVSTFGTLFIVPIMYTAMDDIIDIFRKKKSLREETL